MNPTLNLLRDLPRTGPASAPVVRLPVAHVQSAVDVHIPGRTEYLVSAPTRALVEAEIARLSAQCDAADGTAWANFIGPYRDSDGYVAAGEVILPVTP